MDDSNSSANATPSIPLITDFNLDFVEQNSLNFNHVIEMLRGSEISDPSAICINQNFDPLAFTRNNVSDNYSINNFYPIISQENHVFNNFNSPTMSCTNNNTILNSSVSGFDDETIRGGGGDEDDDDDDDDDNYMDGEHSSATTNNKGSCTSSKKGKMDRSRTLISERKRRGRMKEKLYALRALVPNITKMDKASIVGDAVLYVQDLQMQSKKLRSQIDGLENSLIAAERCQGFGDTPNKNSSQNHFLPVCKMIMQMDVLQIEDREFYVKVVSNKGQGVAASLYKALDSLTTFVIRNSSLSTLYEQFVLTFTLNVAKCREDFNLPNMKVWISGAFLNQGFEFQSF
ncbi:transcription factor FER-LIKE IRON DEFICIENCY-INDUCED TRANSCRIPTION FACTOR [Beta vulgaris subsp. vulgaris]|uniref:transcription factor FER-LIKE IRON DEFICIENCY-INDUCED TRANSCRIPTION FACTOR n=1 Tax=Beta vulgaris subsp. vulgaris TaxID=3555 RepID=UPI0020372F39|nr:transcription factor FER-LIKE IRON DEFICIENCY-INDUCED TRANSCRIPTION FACTOR [Beta vulgaris subsp. vulgaris]